MRPVGLININTKESQIRRHLWKWSISKSLTRCFWFRLIDSFLSCSLPAYTFFPPWWTLFPRLSLLIMFWDLRIVPIPVIFNSLQNFSCIWMHKITPSLPKGLDDKVNEHNLKTKKNNTVPMKQKITNSFFYDESQFLRGKRKKRVWIFILNIA